MAETRKKQSIQTIKLEAFDDVISIRDRLQFVKTQRVLLIFPSKAQILSRKLDLILVQREAERRRLQLALLSRDPEIAEHAASINLSCFTTLRQARSHNWKSARSKIFVDRSQKPSNDIQHPYELIGVASRLRTPRTPTQKRVQWVGRIAIALVVLVILMGSVLMVIPSATVRVTPARDAIQEPITIIADPALTQINEQTASVPAQSVRLLTTGDSITIPTTGRRTGTDSLAQGRAIFSNATESPQFIPAGTVISTSTVPPARFQTLQDAPLAGQVDATVEVEIRALGDTQGLVGNVVANTIDRVEGPLETLVTVRNPAPTFGGGVTELPIVTQEDHARLVTLARQSVIQSARNEFLLQLPGEDKFLVPDSVHIVEERSEWFTYSAQVGDPTESVSLQMRAVVEAIIVDQLYTRQLAIIVLSRRLPAGRELDEEKLTYRREPGGLNANGQYQFQLFVEGALPFAIDPDEVAHRLRGMSLDKALQTLEQEWVLDPNSPPQIATYPFNWGFMPFLAVRIQVEVIDV